MLQILLMAVASCTLLQGCATTTKIDWQSRIEKSSYDDVVLELGPPDKSAKLTDGTMVGEWLLRRGPRQGTVHSGGGSLQSYSEMQTPDFYIRLTFGPDGKLKTWKRVYH